LISLDSRRVTEILPHRPPMLMIDAAPELIPGKSVTAIKYIDPDWDIFRGHFPDQPLLPGVYAIECMAQAADLLVLTLPGNEGKTPLFSGVSHVRFLRPVHPGDTLRIQAELLTDDGCFNYDVKATIYVNEKKAAAGQVTIAAR